jgi:hypothetical protein
MSMERLAFTLPPDLEASEPPEARGLTRDAVRMLVAPTDRRESWSTAPSPCFRRSSSRVTSS